MSRRNLARLVLVVWIAALALLARRELFQSETTGLTAGAARLAPEAMYFRVDAGTLQIGVMNLNWDTLPTGFKVQELLALDLPAGNSIRRHLMLSEAITTRALTLQSASQSLSGGSGSEDVQIEIRSDTVQRYSVQTGGDSGGTSTFRVVGPRPSRTSVLPLRLAAGGRLSAGQPVNETVADLERRASMPVRGRVRSDTLFVLPDSVEFDPATIRWRTITLDTVRAWRVDLEVGGLPERWWVDNAGRLVRLETAFGVTLQRAPFDFSQTLYRDSLRLSGPAPRLALAGVRSLVGAGVALDTLAASMLVTLSRVDRALAPEEVAVLAGAAQTVEGTTVTIQRAWPADTVQAPAAYLPTPEERQPIRRLILMADTAFAGAATARDSVIRLTAWVHRRYTVDTSGMSHPEATLAPFRASGNPDALARITVTLAKVGGLASRVVNGLAVTPGGLLSHSWVEVWVGGGWVPVDPTFGHAPASARLLRISEGGMGRPFETLWRTAALRAEPFAPGSR